MKATLVWEGEIEQRHAASTWRQTIRIVDVDNEDGDPPRRHYEMAETDWFEQKQWIGVDEPSQSMLEGIIGALLKVRR